MDDKRMSQSQWLGSVVIGLTLWIGRTFYSLLVYSNEHSRAGNFTPVSSVGGLLCLCQLFQRFCSGTGTGRKPNDI